MTTKNIQKLNRGIRNLPQKNLGAVVKVIKKRGILYKQNKEKLQLDIDNIEVTKIGILEQVKLFF